MLQWVSPRDIVLGYVEKAFNPDQPRANDGKWTTDGIGSGGAPKDPLGNTARYRQTVGNRSESAATASHLPPGKQFTGMRPMTDEEHAAHVDWVEHTIAEHGGANVEHSGDSTHISQDYVAGVEGNYNDHRRSLQNQILNHYHDLGDSIPNERRGIIMGGLMGAGKTTILRANAADPNSVAGKLGVKYDKYDDKGNGVGNPSNFLVLSPDDVSEQMAAMGMAPHVGGLSPMEATTFFHEEAAQITKDIAAEATHQGKNVIWDISMKTANAGRKRLKALNDAGYHTAGVMVDVTPAQSIRNAALRHKGGQDQYNMGIGDGGRYAPKALMADAADPTGKYRSNNRAAFEELKANGEFNQTLTIDNENYAQHLVAETGSQGVGHIPMNLHRNDSAGSRLAVGDRVHHVDNGSELEGTVESVPDHDVNGRVGVYWTHGTDSEGNQGHGFRESHDSSELVKMPRIDKPDTRGQGTQMARWSYAYPSAKLPA